MGSPIFTSALASARKAMRRHQHLPSSARLPMWRLLAGEVAYVVRLAGSKRDIVVAVVVAVLVTVGLSPATPGPVATPSLRMVIAAAAAAAAWAIAWVLSQPGPAGTNDGPMWRQATSGIGMVLLATVGLAVVAWLLTVLVSLAF